MKLDETRIQLKLYQELLSRGHEIMVPNVSWSWLAWEADLITITKSGYMYEYEIKVTRQDFEADFKKRKHNTLKRAHASQRIPNRFWYVAPLNAIPLCVPGHAGLVLIEEIMRGKFKYISFATIIKAPVLHKQKISEVGRYSILRTLMFKYWNLSKILDQNKLQREIWRP